MQKGAPRSPVHVREMSKDVYTFNFDRVVGRVTNALSLILALSVVDLTNEIHSVFLVTVIMFIFGLLLSISLRFARHELKNENSSRQVFAQTMEDAIGFLTSTFFVLVYQYLFRHFQDTWENMRLNVGEVVILLLVLVCLSFAIYHVILHAVKMNAYVVEMLAAQDKSVDSEPGLQQIKVVSNVLFNLGFMSQPPPRQVCTIAAAGAQG